MYMAFGKRLLDLCIVIPALILLSPLLLFIALLIQVKMGSPVIFRQERAGQSGSSAPCVTIVMQRESSFPMRSVSHPLGAFSVVVAWMNYPGCSTCCAAR